MRTETQFVETEGQLLVAALMSVKVELLAAVALFLLFHAPLVVDTVSVLAAPTEAVCVVAHSLFL